MFDKHEIYDHAVDRYIERVMGENPDDYSLQEKMVFKSHLEDALYNPDRIKYKKGENSKIHVSGDAALIVGVKIGEGKYRPYTRTDRKVTVPTVYHKNTFVEVDNDGERKART